MAAASQVPDFPDRGYCRNCGRDRSLRKSDSDEDRYLKRVCINCGYYQKWSKRTGKLVDSGGRNR